MVKSTALPNFSTIDIDEFTPRFKQLLTDNEQCIDQRLQAERHYTWENLILPMEELEDALDNAFAPIRHLHSVRDNPQWRDAYEQCLAAITDYATQMGQNTQLYQAVKSMADRQDFTNLSPAQQHIINHQLRDFRLAGVDLPAADKARFKQIKARLSELTTAFEQNVLDATQAWQHHVTDERQLAGLPTHALASARERAQRQQRPGWVLTLDFPCYHAVICYADDAALRETIYHAYVTRASDQGPQAGQYDNSELMVEIVRLRHELAQLTGFPSYAHYSLASKMADNPQQVLDFLYDLVSRVRPQAREDFARLEQFAKQQFQMDRLQPWDINYVSEQLRQQDYAISQEDLRPYFPENQVLQGLFDIVHRLYGIAFNERDDIDTWHEEVRFFDLIDEQQQVCGHLYIDLYARHHKRGGAWMDECINRRRAANGELQLPAAFLTCNLAPPSGAMPALFSHDEVVTIFHELGHCLHHLLTQIDYADASGIRGVPWDAVELPSQFFERWAWQPETLTLISQHYQTGETLPSDLIERLLHSRHFQSAMQLVRQLEFALFDLNLHDAAPPTSAADIDAKLQSVREQVSVVPVPDYHRFQHGFGHIFAGGYAAGYYSYLWAEVLACDAFAKFLEQGIFDAETGRQFLNSILSQGGSQEAMDLFIAFRGREPTIDAFLLDNGVETNS